MNAPKFSRNDQQALNRNDINYNGSTFEEVRDAIFANPYYNTWKSEGSCELPVYQVKFFPLLKGLFSRTKLSFKNAAQRTIDSSADLRWGNDLRGQRRLLHPNGVCLTGVWEIDPDNNNDYTGFFEPNSKGRIIGRYSTCCTETKRNRNRSLSLVGKIYPMKTETDEETGEPVRRPPASFISQEDLGGTRVKSINEAKPTNAPNTTFWRRGWAFPILFLTGLVFKLVDKEIAKRQLYEIAELGREKHLPTKAPEFIRFVIPDSQGEKLQFDDFRDEVLSHIFDPGDDQPKGTLTFNIEVSDQGRSWGPAFFQRRNVKNWRKIGKIVFDQAVVSYNGDFVIHFHHPAWRRNRNDRSSAVRKSLSKK